MRCMRVVCRVCTGGDLGAGGEGLDGLLVEGDGNPVGHPVGAEEILLAGQPDG